MSKPLEGKKSEFKQASYLAESDRVVLNIIKSKGDQAISKYNLKQEAKIPDGVLNKCLKKLNDLALIKEVAHVNSNSKRKDTHYIAAEFKPANNVTGGLWYVNGELDTVFIDQLRDICLKIIKKLHVATAEGVYDFFKTKRLINTECTSQQISEILRSMVLENLIIEVKSTGHGEYRSIPVGDVCYRCVGGLHQGPKTGAMASVPCGVCPRIKNCTPDGAISPSTCVYYTKWLQF